MRSFGSPSNSSMVKAKENHRTAVVRQSQHIPARRWRYDRMASYLLAIVGLVALFFAPAMTIRRIQISVGEPLTASEALALKRDGERAVGENLLLAPVGQIEQSLLKHPYCKSVDISRTLFPPGLAIRCRPRTPIALLRAANGNFEVSRDNIIIRRWNGSAPLPTISADSINAGAVGLKISNPCLLDAVQIIVAFSGEKITKVSKLVVAMDGQLWLNMTDGVQVRFGLPDKITKKIQLLRLAYRVDPTIAKRFSVLDFIYPQAPACVLRNNTSTGKHISNTSDVVSKEKLLAPGR